MRIGHGRSIFLVIVPGFSELAVYNSVLAVFRINSLENFIVISCITSFTLVRKCSNKFGISLAYSYLCTPYEYDIYCFAHSRPIDVRLGTDAAPSGLAGQILLLPLIGLAIGFGFQLEAVFFLGVMLIACSPGGSSSNVFSMLAGGDVALSVSLTMLSSIITLFTGPLVMSYATGLVGENQSITLPVGNLLVQNIVLMLVPIIIGLSVAMWREQLARKMHGVLKKLAFPALILLASIFFIQNRETIVREFPQLGLAMTVLILLAMGGGVALSWAMRLSGREQRTIIIEIGMQNAAQAISIASSPFVFANDVMAIPAIVYALMMNIILLAYVGIIKTTTRQN